MEDRPLILIADHNGKNLEVLAQVLGRRGYRCLTANTLGDLDIALAEANAISLALIDLGGFDEGIWTRCGALRQSSIPFLVISPKDLRAARQVGLQQGATGVLVKPLVADELFGLIKTMLGT